jgi:hypothetical protein
MSTQLELHL